MDFSIITKAGLTRAEAASIVGVSEVMVWKWVHGEAEPRNTYRGLPLRRRTEIFLNTLERLVAKGQLPKNDLRIHRYADEKVRQRRAKMLTQIKGFVDSQVASTPANG